MKDCFIIQPFDKGRFDKRCKDVFKPAIESAGLKPYRVDEDLSVDIPIESIEKGITNADMCLADISSDNPNVWFELGYAIAKKKDIIMLCSNERNTKLPFDIHHRRVVEYDTSSSSDFDKLKKDITNSIKAILKKNKGIKSIISNPIVTKDELTTDEIVALVSVAQNIESLSTGVSVNIIRDDIMKAGYTKIAVVRSLHRLHKSGYIKDGKESDWNGNVFTIYYVTDKGMDWLQQNGDRLVLKQELNTKGEVETEEIEEIEEIPF